MKKKPVRNNIVQREREGMTSFLQPDGSWGPIETAERFPTFAEVLHHTIRSQGPEYAVTILSVEESR